jgi:large subunit ribosomal protein L13
LVTYTPKAKEITHEWYLIDAKDVPLGRLASQVAQLLMGKHKPIYTPNADTGDHVVIVNAEAVKLTANKADLEFAYRHSGYPGGLKKISFGELLRDDPEKLVKKTVGGMLPKTKLGKQMINKLHVHVGSEHTHQAQKPIQLEIKS